MEVIVYTHTHWDREWYRTLQQYKLKLVEVIDLVLDQIEKGQLEYYTLDGQSIVLDDYLDIRKQSKERLKRHIKSGKILIGPWYVLPDEFLVSGESLLENLRLGIEKSLEFGNVNNIGYLPDSFGHSIDIPLILNKFNINESVIWRGVNTANSEFLWVSKDNSGIITYHLVEGYYNTLFIDQNQAQEEKHKQITEWLDKISVKSKLDCILLPVGGDHLPPPIDLKKQIEEYNSAQIKYKLKQGSIKQFLELINVTQIEEQVQTEFRDCTKSFILPGVYSSRLYLKQSNARLTNKIISHIEPLSAYCNLLKLDDFVFPDSEYLWKMLLENHPHDSICGCSIDEVHEEMEQRYKSLDQACIEITNRAKYAIAKQLSKGQIAVFNSSNFSYSGPVQINDSSIDLSLDHQPVNSFTDRHYQYYSNVNEFLPATKIIDQKNILVWSDNIPSKSLKILDNKTIPNRVTVEDSCLTNGLIKIIINDDSITLKDLTSDKEYKNLNQIIDRLDSGDSYNYAPGPNTYNLDTENKAQIISYEIIESGPIRGTIRVIYEIFIPEALNETRLKPSYKLIQHTITCDILINANSKLVEFNLTWLNKSQDHILQAKLPTEKDIDTILSENHFCTLEREVNPNYNILENIPDTKLTETKTNTAPTQRFIMANDLAVFNEGLPEYEVYKSNIYVTLLRSTGYLSRADVSTRTAEAGPNLSTPGLQCLRNCSARYAIHPKTSINELYRLSENFMGYIIPIEGIGKESSRLDNLDQPLISWNNTNIISTRLKFTEEDNSSELHLLNISNDQENIILKSFLKIDKIYEINLLNEIILEIDPKRNLVFPPNELKILKITYKPSPYHHIFP